MRRLFPRINMSLDGYPGVLDERRLIVSPVSLGGGTRLCGAEYPKAELHLMRTRQCDSGALPLAHEGGSR